MVVVLNNPRGAEIAAEQRGLMKWILEDDIEIWIPPELPWWMFTITIPLWLFENPKNIRNYYYYYVFQVDGLVLQMMAQQHYL